MASGCLQTFVIVVSVSVGLQSRITDVQSVGGFSHGFKVFLHLEKIILVSFLYDKLENLKIKYRKNITEPISVEHFSHKKKLSTL